MNSLDSYALRPTKTLLGWASLNCIIFWISYETAAGGKAFLVDAGQSICSKCKTGWFVGERRWPGTPRILCVGSCFSAFPQKKSNKHIFGLP